MEGYLSRPRSLVSTPYATFFRPYDMYNKSLSRSTKLLSTAGENYSKTDDSFENRRGGGGWGGGGCLLAEKNSRPSQNPKNEAVGRRGWRGRVYLSFRLPFPAFSLAPKKSDRRAMKMGARETGNTALQASYEACLSSKKGDSMVVRSLDGRKQETISSTRIILQVEIKKKFL